MSNLQEVCELHNLNIDDVVKTLSRVAVTAIENNLSHDFDAAFTLMLERDAAFIKTFQSDTNFKNSVCGIVNTLMS